MRLRARLGRPRTVRLRLTVLYGVLFLLSGAGLLATTYVLMEHATAGVPGQQAPGAVPTVGPARPAHEQATRDRDEQMRQLLIQSGIALGFMAVVSVGLGWVMAGRVLRPLRTITTAARDASATNLRHRLALQGPDDELKELGDTFDALLARLDASFESQRRFVANASHELRTPLALQRTLIQVALADPDATRDSLRAAHERVLAATYQQERLIDALLTLARGERGLDRHRAVDLAEVAGRVLAGRDPNGIEVVPALREARTAGDPRLVERLVSNLVDNALTHNVPDGRVEVCTATTPGGAVLSIANTGPVVPAEQVDRLFEPFQRLGTDRGHHDGGLGLGLSIVQAIANTHGATVQAHPRTGGGLNVTVTFPGLRFDPGTTVRDDS